MVHRTKASSDHSVFSSFCFRFLDIVYSKWKRQYAKKGAARVCWVCTTAEPFRLKRENEEKKIVIKRIEVEKVSGVWVVASLCLCFLPNDALAAVESKTPYPIRSTQRCLLKHEWLRKEGLAFFASLAMGGKKGISLCVCVLFFCFSCF